MNRASHAAAYGHPRAAFTLTELMVVILIIGILVAVLIPAVNAVRVNARKTVTKAAIGTLSTGLETYRADQTLGGAYPPSASDRANGGQLTYEIANPFSNLNNHPGGTGDIEITGAGLLVGALAGFDLLGTPGFRPFRSASQFWSEDTDDRFDSGTRSNSGAYALDDATGEPVWPRVGPLVELSNLRVSRWNPNATNSDGSRGSFEIPAEIKASQSRGDAGGPPRLYPMFLDAFDQPILYWRADPAGVRIADDTPNNVGRPQERGIYHFRDNSPLLVPGVGSQDDVLVINVHRRRRREMHDLRMQTSRASVRVDDVMSDPDQSFARHILDRDVTARAQPQNAKTYLLLSAGPDGVFGTTDDIANFEPNGGQQP